MSLIEQEEYGEDPELKSRIAWYEANIGPADHHVYHQSKFYSNGKPDLKKFAKELGRFMKVDLEGRIEIDNKMRAVASIGEDEELTREEIVAGYATIYSSDHQAEDDAKNLKEAEEHGAAGRGTLTPDYFTLSYPGVDRGPLYYHLRLTYSLSEYGTVHATYDTSKKRAFKAVKVPQEWINTFGAVKEWGELLNHIAAITVNKKKKFKNGKVPEWFITRWGQAAWNSAKNSETKKSGVILLSVGNHYKNSPWCVLEFLFCKCLVKLYGPCVYRITTYAPFFAGHYLQVGENLADY